MLIYESPIINDYSPGDCIINRQKCSANLKFVAIAALFVLPFFLAPATCAKVDKATIDRFVFLDYQRSGKKNLLARSKYSEALRAHETGQNERAIKLFNEVLALDPQCKEAMYTLGSVYMYEEQYVKALETYSRALKIDPVFKHALYRRAFAYASMYRYKDTVSDLNKLLSMEPDYEGARALRIKCLVELGNLPAAIDDSTELLRVHPMSTEDRLQRARLYVKDKQPLMAIKDFSFLLKHFPDESDAYVERADQYFALGRYKEAVADYNAALSGDTDNFKHCREQIALCLKKQGK